MSKHTPGELHPRQEFANRWRLEQYIDMGIEPRCVAIVTNTACEVGSMDDAAVAANAARLAMCWNCHDELVEACRKAMPFLRDADHLESSAEENDALAAIRAALARTAPEV